MDVHLCSVFKSTNSTKTLYLMCHIHPFAFIQRWHKRSCMVQYLLQGCLTHWVQGLDIKLLILWRPLYILNHDRQVSSLLKRQFCFRNSWDPTTPICLYSLTAFNLGWTCCTFDTVFQSSNTHSMFSLDPDWLSNRPPQCFGVKESTVCPWAIWCYRRDDAGVEPVGGTHLPGSTT